LDALENPSTSDKPRAKSKKRSPKKVKLEKGSGDGIYLILLSRESTIF